MALKNSQTNIFKRQKVFDLKFENDRSKKELYIYAYRILSLLYLGTNGIYADNEVARDYYKKTEEIIIELYGFDSEEHTALINQFKNVI